MSKGKDRRKCRHQEGIGTIDPALTLLGSIPIPANHVRRDYCEAAISGSCFNHVYCTPAQNCIIAIHSIYLCPHWLPRSSVSSEHCTCISKCVSMRINQWIANLKIHKHGARNSPAIYQVWICPHLPADMRNHMMGSMCIDDQGGEAFMYQRFKEMNDCAGQRMFIVSKCSVPVADVLVFINK